MNEIEAPAAKRAEKARDEAERAAKVFDLKKQVCFVLFFNWNDCSYLSFIKIDLCDMRIRNSTTKLRARVKQLRTNVENLQKVTYKI